MKCCREEYPLDRQPCQGEVDEYYGTDGGTANLCEHHMKQCRHLVWDDGHPMTKKYCDEVYTPMLDFADELRQQIYVEFGLGTEAGFNQQAYMDWLQTDAGKARLNENKLLNEDMQNKLMAAAYPEGSKYRAKPDPIV
jgi:hypothetical protein